MKRCVEYSPLSAEYIERNSKNPKAPQWSKITNEAIETLNWISQHVNAPLSKEEMTHLVGMSHPNNPPYNLYVSFLTHLGVASEDILYDNLRDLAKKLKNMSQFEQWAILAKLKSPLIS